MGKRLTIVLAVAAFLPFIAYPSAYFALVTRYVPAYDPYGLYELIPCDETYRAGGPMAKAMFRPMNKLDRILRPEHWREP